MQLISYVIQHIFVLFCRVLRWALPCQSATCSLHPRPRARLSASRPRGACLKKCHFMLYNIRIYLHISLIFTNFVLQKKIKESLLLTT